METYVKNVLKLAIDGSIHDMSSHVINTLNRDMAKIEEEMCVLEGNCLENDDVKATRIELDKLDPRIAKIKGKAKKFLSVLRNINIGVFGVNPYTNPVAHADITRTQGRNFRHLLIMHD